MNIYLIWINIWEDCLNNKLKNLIGCPKYVNGRLSFRYNPLESLDGYDGNYDKIIVDNIEKFIRKKKITELLNNI